MNFERYRTLRLAQLERERELLDYTQRLEEENARLRDTAQPGNYLVVTLREKLREVCERHGERVPMSIYMGILSDLPVDARQRAIDERLAVLATLAELDPLYRDAHGAPRCALCGRASHELPQHDVDCPWLRAQALAAPDGGQ